MIRRLFLSLLAASFVVGMSVSVAGCNTVEGMGKDVEQGGKALKDEAREHKKDHD